MEESSNIIDIDKETEIYILTDLLKMATSTSSSIGTNEEDEKKSVNVFYNRDAVDDRTKEIVMKELEKELKKKEYLIGLLTLTMQKLEFNVNKLKIINGNDGDISEETVSKLVVNENNPISNSNSISISDAGNSKKNEGDDVNGDKKFIGRVKRSDTFGRNKEGKGGNNDNNNTNNDPRSILMQKIGKVLI